ncbi:MAG: ATP-binding protein [Deferribacterales bacterium]
MNRLFLIKRSGTVITGVAVFAVLIYVLTDSYIDARFRNDNVTREIFEKLTVGLLFLMFTSGLYVILRVLNKLDRQARERDEKYKTYINNSPDPIIVCDRTGRIVETNPSMYDISGYTETELTAMTIQQMWADESVKQGYAALAKMLNTDSLDITLKFLKKDGADYFLSCHAVRVGDNRFLVMCRDMTSYVIMDSRIRQMHDELKEKVEEELKKRHRQENLIENQKKMADMSKLLSAIAHQWRQPLNILSLYSIDLNDTYKAGELNDKYMDDYNTVVTATIDKMSDIIDDFRLFFAPEKAAAEFCVAAEILDVMSILQAQLNYLGIDIELQCKCGKQHIACRNVAACPDCSYRWMFVRGEQGRFRHVMLNLIYNSIDAINEKNTGSAGHKGKISISVSCVKDSVRISVADNGTGLSDEVREHVFEPYFSTKEEGKGSGIGLFMSRLVVKDQMHGDIELQNTKDGAEAVIVLPVIKDQSSSTLTM